MKIVYFANGVRGTRCLEAMCSNGFIPVAVVLHPDKLDGGKPSATFQIASQNGIPVFYPRDVNDPVFINTLSVLSPDLFVLSGYGKILKSDILRMPPMGAINLHGGRLPEYRGGSPINWQIINGEKRGGCCVLYVDEGIDTGAILCQETYEIGGDMTAGEAIEITLDIFPRLLLTALQNIKSGAVLPEKQLPQNGVYYCKRYPDDGYIDWSALSARRVHDLVRGLCGAGLPGAFTYLDGKKVVIWKTAILDPEVKGLPGRIALKRGDGVVVIASDRGVLVQRVQPEGVSDPVLAGDYFKINGATFK